MQIGQKLTRLNNGRFFRHVFSVLFFIVLLSIVTGCSSDSREIGDRYPAIPFVAIGYTPLSDVLDLFSEEWLLDFQFEITSFDPTEYAAHLPTDAGMVTYDLSRQVEDTVEIGGIRFEVKHSDSGEVNLMLIAEDQDGNTDAFRFTMDRSRNLSDEEAERDIHFFKLVLKQGTMQQDFHIANRKDGFMSLRQWIGSESVDIDENEYSFKPPKGYMDADYKTTVANYIENMQLSWEDKQYTFDVTEVYLDGYVARGTWEFMGQKGVAYITTD